jgi:hypothetical protein
MKLKMAQRRAASRQILKLHSLGIQGIRSPPVTAP